ncbi:hypothetical protein BR93DRAFT_698236 [Coniochaeta sp. PMI_546]|nr:hypothetical protein BR93DRAFT_698236 [Coniochaeta sp. PMI_546]
MPMLENIAHNYAKGVFDATAQYFLPEGKIESLVTALAIKKEAPKLSDDIIRWILKDAKRLFVIGLKSLHSNPDLLKPALERFKEIKFDDSSIPITSEPPEDNEDDETDTSDKQIWESFGCKGVWGRQHLIAFHQEQWKYFAPVFEDGIFHYELSAHHILPVTWKHKLAHEGGFATVHKVEMHEAHQRIGPKGGKGPYKTVSRETIWPP